MKLSVALRTMNVTARGPEWSHFANMAFFDDDDAMNSSPDADLASASEFTDAMVVHLEAQSMFGL